MYIYIYIYIKTHSDNLDNLSHHPRVSAQMTCNYILRPSVTHTNIQQHSTACHSLQCTTI